MTKKETNAIGPATMAVTPPAGLVDEPLRIVVRGLPAGIAVTIRAYLQDARGVPWNSHAVFIADGDGTVDLTTHAPVSGTYSGVDGEGLIASMAVAPGVAGQLFDDASILPIDVHFVANVGGDIVATADVRRRYVATDVETTAVNECGLSGLFFRPNAEGSRPGVVVLGGSSGGLMFSSQVAGLLASHGFACLALAYFGSKGLPEHLIEIPIEYFAEAMAWLSQQRGVAGDGIGIVGRSRGAELALLLGSRFPAIRAVVAYCPSNAAWNGLRGGAVADASAWTESGRSLPFVPLTSPSLSAQLQHVFSRSPIALTPLFEAALDGPRPSNALIAVEKTNGPMLLISGESDEMWPATRMGDEIMQRLVAHGHPFASRHCHYVSAGHLMRAPGVPTTVLHGRFALGGNGPAQASANRAAWSETLAFLTMSLGLRSDVDDTATIGV
jgi:dienelactone hydrolase